MQITTKIRFIVQLISLWVLYYFSHFSTPMCPLPCFGSVLSGWPAVVAAALWWGLRSFYERHFDLQSVDLCITFYFNNVNKDHISSISHQRFIFPSYQPNSRVNKCIAFTKHFWTIWCFPTVASIYHLFVFEF
jgi:hypothetical protein